MIDISISLTAAGARKDRIKGSATAVIDVLRATSVITTALTNGAKGIIPVKTVEEAQKQKILFPNAILGGERDAIKLPGFDNGNSPFEYPKEVVDGKMIILSTTNGTLALSKTLEAEVVLIASFLNLGSVVEELARQNIPIHILCSGTKGEFSMDDFLCAGAVISELENKISLKSDDLSELAKNTWKDAKSDIHSYLRTCKHYNILKNNGFGRDLEYCFQINTIDSVPKLDLKTLIIA